MVIILLVLILFLILIGPEDTFTLVFTLIWCAFCLALVSGAVILLISLFN